VVQKEQSSLDKFFSKLCLKLADTYIVHALKTYEELKSLLPNLSYELTFDGKRKDRSDVKHVIKLFHPIYDLYKVDKNFDVLAFKNKYKLQKNVFLFFGFIRKYKGLHNVIAAFNALSKKRNDVSLLICGESFWNTLEPNNFSTKFKKFLFGSLKKLLLKKADDESDYNPLAMIEELGLRDRVVVFNEFIPNEDVHKYFQVSNAVVLYYLTATPSGIESLSYNFNLPILATKVGHFPETIFEGTNGFLAEENIESMTAIMEKFLDNPIPWENVDRYKEKLSWSSYADAILA
jgi:glycosyltransferase involved in cell wall biosynthesis